MRNDQLFLNLVSWPQCKCVLSGNIQGVKLKAVDPA